MCQRGHMSGMMHSVMRIPTKTGKAQRPGGMKTVPQRLSILAIISLFDYSMIMQNANVLLTTDAYAGKYVALRSFEDNTVVCCGDDPLHVIDEARKAEFPNAVLIYVPEKDTVGIY